jgi:hypothetical protein
MTGWTFRGAECADRACRSQAALQGASRTTRPQMICPLRRCANNRRLMAWRVTELHGAQWRRRRRGRRADGLLRGYSVRPCPGFLTTNAIPRMGGPDSTVLRELGKVRCSAGHLRNSDLPKVFTISTTSTFVSENTYCAMKHESTTSISMVDRQLGYRLTPETGPSFVTLVSRVFQSIDRHKMSLWSLAVSR